MRRTHAIVALALLATACRPGEQLGTPTTPTPTSTTAPATPAAPRAPAAGVSNPTGAPAIPGSVPDVRIGISLDTPSVRITADTRYEIQTVAGKSIASAGVNDTLTITASAEGRITARMRDRVVVDNAQPPLRVVPDRLIPFVLIDGRRYRGEVLLLTPHAGKVTAVNVTDMESYLLGVVPREMGKRPATEIEALKAQAVAARTYAVGNMGGHNDQGFDFYATVLDQVYGGTADEDSIVTRAVMETRGQIIMYDNKPILAYYASTCGGETASIEESWPARSPLPYLRSRSDKVPGTEDYYCKSSSRFNWKTEWTRAQLLDVLSTTLRAHTKGAVTAVRSVDDVSIVSRGPSGRATVDLVADGKKYRIRADSIRWVMRPAPTGGILNSSRLYNVSATKGDDGHIDHLAIDGGGWGHAIGMCQVGAMARARAGQSFRDILGAYYTGVTIQSLYQ